MTVVARSWVFSPQIVAADPGPGYVRFSHRNIPTTTAFYLNSVDVNGIDRSAGIALITAGDIVRVNTPDDTGRWAQFMITGPPVDNTGWFTLPVTRMLSSDPALTMTSGAAYLFTLFAPAVEGTETAYATVEELARILQITSPTAAQTAAMERVLDAAATEIDNYLGVPLPLVDPYPALIVQVNLARAAELWKQEQSPFGLVFSGETASFTSSDTFKRHKSVLLPLKTSFGVG